MKSEHSFVRFPGIKTVFRSIAVLLAFEAGQASASCPLVDGLRPIDADESMQWLQVDGRIINWFGNPMTLADAKAAILENNRSDTPNDSPIAIEAVNNPDCTAANELINFVRSKGIGIVRWVQRDAPDASVQFESFYDDVAGRGYEVSVTNKEGFAIRCTIEVKGTRQDGAARFPVNLNSVISVSANGTNAQSWRGINSSLVESSTSCERQ